MLDNAYLFSLARENFGRIIIDRSSRSCKSGENVFDVLKIDRDELEFLLGAVGRGETSCAALIGRANGEPRAVMFMIGLCRFTSMCLCIELEASASAVASVICDGAVEGISASDGLGRLAASESGLDQLKEAYEYIVRVLDGVSELCMMKTARQSVSVHEIRRIAISASDFIGISPDVNAYCLGEPSLDTGRVFAGGFCASAIIIMAMMARKYSSGRELALAVCDGGSGVQIDFCFDGDDVPDQMISDILMVAGANNVVMSYRNDEGIHHFGLIPHYEDVGLVGLKAHDDIF